MPILPIGMYDVYQRAHISDVFILPQYWGNDRYREYYTSKTWDTVIIDNAMYEQPDCVKFGDLISIANSIRATRTFCVAPEDYHDTDRTFELLNDTVDTYGVLGPSWRIMCVLHGKPREMRTLHSRIKLTMNGLCGIGIPVSVWRDGYDRASLYRYMDMESREYVHALGCDSILEIYNLCATGFSSIDSSIVASAAVNGINMWSRFIIKREGKPTDPVRVDLLQEEFSKDEIENTYDNTVIMRDLCYNGRM